MRRWFPSESVLGVGYGDGYFIGGLPYSIHVRVGVDLSSKSIAFAKAFHPDCAFYDQNVNAIKDTLNIVAAIEMIKHIPENELPGLLTLFVSVPMTTSELYFQFPPPTSL